MSVSYTHQDVYKRQGYAHPNAVVKGSDVENYNALLKLNLELSKRLNVGLSLRAYAATKKYLHGSIDPVSYTHLRKKERACL